MLSFLSSLPFPALRILDIDSEANKFHDRYHQMYEAALLTRCYTQPVIIILLFANKMGQSLVISDKVLGIYVDNNLT